MKLVVGDEQFASKAALQRRVQEILRQGLREIVGDDAKFLRSLFDRHPSAVEKYGVGISRIRAVRVLPFGTIGFEIERLDGTRTDISYKECLTPSKPSFWFSQSCRTAVVDQIQAAKQLAFSTAPEIACPVHGTPITWESCQVHHEAPWEFEAIVAAFLAARAISPDTVEYAGGDNVTASSFVDAALAQDFADFHRARAVLRVVSKRANQSTLRRAAR